jgi:hypothetical protein
MNLSVAIMHCDWVPERRACVVDMVRELRRGGITPAVVKDTRRNLWHTARRSWLQRQSWASHHLVLQDDVRLCAGFAVEVARVLEVASENPVAFFSFHGSSVKKATASGSSWIVSPSPGTGCALAMPAGLVEDFLRWERAHVDPAAPHDDDRMRLWSVARGVSWWITNPSLVEHVGVKSVQGNNPPISRTASRLWDGSPVDWHAGRAAPEVLNRPEAFTLKNWMMYRGPPIPGVHDRRATT